MHLTLESDYAVRIVAHLARLNCRQDAKTISENTGVTLRFALKILRKFVAKGIITSFKGTQGGYELLKKPDQITLREVIETVEGIYFISRCLSPDHGCMHGESETCKVQVIYDTISTYVRDQLDLVTFDQLL